MTIHECCGGYGTMGYPRRVSRLEVDVAALQAEVEILKFEVRMLKPKEPDVSHELEGG